MAWIPDFDPTGTYNGPMEGVLTTEAVNPLYIGEYSVGPYVAGNVAPSGTPQSAFGSNTFRVYQYPYAVVVTNLAPSDAAGNCSTGSDGTESEPLPVASGGWWNRSAVRAWAHGVVPASTRRRGGRQPWK